MPSAKETSIIESLLEGILENEYLKKLYHELLENYRAKLFSQPCPHEEISVSDAIQFASLLSLSKNLPTSVKHHKFAQELASLLFCLYPKRRGVRQAISEILTNLGNFPGAEISSKNYQSNDPLRRTYDALNSQYFAIPNCPGSVFSKDQKEVYDHLFQDNFSYSGPTSMGKTFLIQVYIRERILSGIDENFVILVPSRALINEVSSSMTEKLRDLLQSKDYRIVTSVNSVYLEQQHHFVFVLTPERLIYLLTQKSDTNIDFLFIDEAHKVASLQGRSGYYYQCVTLLRERNPKARIIYASPNVVNPELFLSLSETDNENSKRDSLHVMESPVSQLHYLVNLNQRVIKPFDDIGGVFLEESPLPVEIDGLISLIRKVAGFDNKNPQQTLVYCSSKEKTIRYAAKLCESLKDKSDPELDSFAKAIVENIGPEYCLSDFVRKGVAVHVGYLPSSIRMTLERLFKSRKLNVIFCTSTLIEGVNLPADHLFVTSRKNWKSNMTPIEFRNLIGRVGRISYSLSGNVYFVINGKAKKDEERDYARLVMTEPKSEEFSVEKMDHLCARTIIERLRNGKASLYPEDLSCNINDEKYDFYRKMSTILLSDICRGNNSLVLKSFRKIGLTKDEERQIREKFSGENAKKTEDISFSLDQEQSLSEAVALGELSYPKPHYSGSNPHFNYDETLYFLKQISKVFQWNHYEKKLYGEDGTKLRYYAQLLLRWMAGTGLSLMVRNELEYRAKHEEKKIFCNGNQETFDSTNPLHRNLAISELLERIQNDLLFSVANYFLKLSTEYKKQYGEDSLQGNDWYEFVEFGSCNVDSIFLQRSGYSRESAVYLLERRGLFILITDGKLKLNKNAIDSYAREDVRAETQDIFYNDKDLFICDKSE